jgi:hypothetical protein
MLMSSLSPPLEDLLLPPPYMKEASFLYGTLRDVSKLPGEAEEFLRYYYKLAPGKASRLLALGSLF